MNRWMVLSLIVAGDGRRNGAATLGRHHFGKLFSHCVCVMSVGGRWKMEEEDVKKVSFC